MAYETAILIGLVGVIAILCYISSVMEKKSPLKLLFTFLSMFIILLTVNVMAVMAAESTNIRLNTAMVYQICLWCFVFTFGYVIILFVRNTIEESKENKRRKEEDE